MASITIPDNVTSIGEAAFYYCEGLTNIVIPDNVTGIGEFAFAQCSTLTSITIPENVTCIEKGTFDQCIGLKCVTFGKRLTSIGERAFDGCDDLSDVYYGGTKIDRTKIEINECYGGVIDETHNGNAPLINATWHYQPIDYSSYSTLILPADLKVISAAAFSGTAAELIVIPASVTSVAADAFDNCPNLQYIVNCSDVTITAPNGVIVIGE